MSQQKKLVFKTKKEIYQDYQIAIKLQIEPVIHISSYEELFNSLNDKDRAEVENIGWIDNYQTEYPLSFGVFIEIPEKTKDGEEIGVRYLMLKHETGIESFFMAGAALLATDIVKDLGKQVFESVAKSSLDKLFSSAKEWYKSMNRSVVYVEIRTANHGIMRVNFKDFKISQLECLIDNFDSIQHLSELNQPCFGGNLLDIDRSHD